MLINKIKVFYIKYEDYASPLFLLGGFVFDNLTLRRIDLWAENLMMIIYLGIALVGVLFINFFHAGRIQYLFFKKFAVYFPFILQFVFGGLFSAFFIFYFRSASIGTSWLFILMLATILVGNEKFQKRYLRFNFQISIFFIALFSYMVFALPIFLGRMGVGIFLLSGIFSLVFAGLIIFLVFKVQKIKFNKNNRAVVSIVSIYVIFNFLYFLNIIPPIPLVLKEDNVYHEVKKIQSGYEVSLEPFTWRGLFNREDSMIHWQKGKPVYYYSAIFAPTKISANIFHRWSYFDITKGNWVISDTLSFKITGGRDGGYRGYSFKYGMKPGKWRVDVVTDRGQILGGKKFEVVEVNIPPKLEKRIR
ncbi:hypothetical protein A2331_01315 [Candidatus Falkowbacteria bacterium RIFOXYB2_FULL_34_18]|uniref:DUF2914 domain-containing protein n=1 Tax=Candidatus Falkowbacteria bacterium RIFOXYD2_FULL_34_120 TaxID=1798007 RepID=A0A1F5TPN9_9BACT|nr:MAG: hypothetical protein A2331_01315 [Candidatus Falkowbacteria bacterium RIFOXYB2_FULL_34_18]OGF29256.1 MAG: hypothetical protein A2500_05195 [Candidatus Falkowbacteria bacterium RIFOXYC12_FULL_34_55]OGF36372.1 MAG: hypothetical protein A2466_00855 [Candidatus Falkowbacteria bacterium RIFOXYC2_FULL_34_220]OGF38851.1 MAG: hypothetical protein A2515_05615 [Candidatus Falkowbacteria bacterium RIFOXYD12_FULL_34_57]OGF40870.1 MAG: hypothetical protein A2531_03840 [Candidatus Falkowbacteria bact